MSESTLQAVEMKDLHLTARDALALIRLLKIAEQSLGDAADQCDRSPVAIWQRMRSSLNRERNAAREWRTKVERLFDAAD